VRVVTFMGNATYVEQVLAKNRLTDAYIDTSYVYYLNGSTFSFLSTSDIEALKNELTSHGVNVVTYDTGIPYVGDALEMQNRRLRIAKMIYKITSDIDDDILFVDSDVIFNDDVFKELPSNEPATICIPALMKPSTSIIFDFCYSTNIYVPHNYISKLKYIVRRYIDNNWHTFYPIDIYINTNLGTYMTLYIKGVCHYIKGKLFCV